MENKHMSERKYLPTFADLVDRLCITQMKAIFLPERQSEYDHEMSLIMHDIDLILVKGAKSIVASDIRAILVLMLSNRFIWENESKAREGGSEQDRLLKLTHSINGVRNTAKNAIAHIDGGRKDYKTDCFAAELVEDFGNWNVFGVQNGGIKSYASEKVDPPRSVHYITREEARAEADRMKVEGMGNASASHQK